MASKAKQQKKVRIERLRLMFPLRVQVLVAAPARSINPLFLAAHAIFTPDLERPSLN